MGIPRNINSQLVINTNFISFQNLIESLKCISEDIQFTSKPNNMNLNINSFIKKQPAPNYHLRYIDEPRGVLTGYRTSQEKLNKIINYPQVNILLPPGSAKREFFILVSLHNSDNECLSPHLLMRRGEKKPNYRFIFEQIPKISSLEYSWELRDYVMVRSKQGHYKDTFVEKQNEYGQLQLPLAFETLRGDVDIENEQSLKQSGDLIVSLGFTIFEKIVHNGANTFRLCPPTLFSNPIYNGDDLNIQKICNLNGYKNESTEVTLLIVFNSNYDINVVIKRIDEIEWTKVIKIGKNEKFHNAAITFQAPPYDGPSCFDDQITTAIHVEVENTLYRSNEVKFCYRNNVTEEPKRKRTCNENGENVAANVNANESSCSPPDLQNAVATISTENGTLNSTINNAQINLVLDNNLNQNGGNVKANINANEISCAPQVFLNNSCSSVATISAENGPWNLPTNEAQINHMFNNNLNANFINDNFINDNFINDNSTANNAQINLVLDNNLNQNGGNVAENINGNQISFAPPVFPNNSCSSVATISAENGPRNLPTNEAQINYVFHNNLNENFINDNFINDNSTANNAQIVLDNSLNQNGGNVAENINGNEISCDPQVFLNNSCSSVATISAENGPRNLPTNEAQINHTFHNNLNENFINENYNNDNFINDNSTANNAQINLVLDNNLNQNGENVAENMNNEISCAPQVFLNNSCSSVATISAENGPRNSPTNETQIDQTFHNNLNANFINDNFINDNSTANAQINLVLDNNLNQNGGNVAENINGNEIRFVPQVFPNNSCSSVATISAENGPRNLPANETQIIRVFRNNRNENFNNDNFINDNSTTNNAQINLALDNNFNQNGGNVADSCSSVATTSAQNGPRNSPTNEAQINHTLHNNLNANFIIDNFINDNFIDDNFINDNFRWSPDNNFENLEFNIEFFERCQDVVPQELIYDDGKIPNEHISRDSATTDIDENVLNEKVSNLSGQTPMEQNSTSLQKPNIGEKIIVAKETSQEMPARNINSQIMIKHKKSIKIMDINNKDLNILFHQALLNIQNLHRFYKGFQDIHYKPLVRQARNAERENLLHYACKYNKAFGIRPLIGLDCRINEQDIYGRTPLHIALDCRHYECVFKIQQLLENHTKYPKEIEENFIKMFKVYNCSGYTVLHVAILRNHLKLVEIMLKFCREHEINIFDYEVLGTGDSVVHLVVQRNLIDMAKILRRYLSSKDYGTITNYLGQTAMELPKISNEMESLFLKKL